MHMYEILNIRTHMHTVHICTKNKHVCMHVCMGVCVHACMYVYVYVLCMYVYACMYVYVSVYIHYETHICEQLFYVICL